MTDRLDAVRTSDVVRDTYLRYLRTLMPLRDAAIEQAVHRALVHRNSLVKGPVLEATPPYASGATLGSLIDEGIVAEGLRELGHTRGIPLDRPLYSHQEEAIRRGVRGRNLVVATGTGSGKTESFLLPILHHLEQERAAGTLHDPGVRALLLYPMNALANDQLKRFRQLLAPLPDITFGRYTGETRQRPDDAEQQFGLQHAGQTAPTNELLSREQIQERPPHLLLTNYAMLEYLLLRPRDTSLFDGDTGRHWRFIVLDEAHVYDGASGIEVGMLLRRLKDRVARERELQYIATSATVGGTGAGPQVAAFASTLFAGDFEYAEDDGGERDVIWATRAPVAADVRWGPLDPTAYAALLNPDDPAELARTFAQWPEETEYVAALAAEQRIAIARSILASGPRSVHDVAGQLFPECSADDALVMTESLVALAAGTHGPNGAPLLPARYHLCARATEGAFACLGASGPHAYLTRHERCDECDSQVVEVGSCKRCASTYLVGVVRRQGDDRYLAPATSVGQHLDWFVLLEQEGSDPGVEATALLDEDDEILEDVEVADLPKHTPMSLCVRCGRLGAAGAAACSCGGGTRAVLAVDDARTVLQSCALCGGWSNAGQIRRLTSGTDAAVSVLTTALYQALPPATDPDHADKPGGGRKLLLFADSRQDAAYFAPYLAESYDRFARTRIVYEAVGRAGDTGEDPRLDDVAAEAMKVAATFNMFDWKARRAQKEKEARTWVHGELLSVAAATGVEALGLVAFGLLRPPRLVMPTPLLDLGLDDDRAWDFVCELLRTLRIQGAVSFPDDVAADNAVFEPRTGPIYMRLEGPERKRKVLSWLPGRGQSTRTSFVERVLAVSGAEATAGSVLDGIWAWLSNPKSPAAELLHATADAGRGALFQLNHELITARLVTDDRPVYRCSRCQRLAPTNVLGVCTTLRCEGTLQSWSPPDEILDDNHYRDLARSLNAVPLQASEHTAQFRPEEAARVQEGFIDGDINVLSCSTTFELGVDVGELQSVVLRNVPPRTSNYVQRAGRAGRRTDSAALVVTYAQQRSHDLTFFAEPDRMIGGEVRPPRITIENERIAQRHAQAVAMAAFFRHAADTWEADYRSAADLFGDTRDDERLVNWLRAMPVEVSEAARRAIPASLHQLVALDSKIWVDRLIELIERLALVHRADVDGYRSLEEEASAEGNHVRAQVYQRVVRTFEKRSLLSVLSGKGVLPKYGFPVDTVELQTAHVPHRRAAQLSLDRDLRVAISDYAPGTSTVAGGFLWTSAGVRRLPERDFPRRHYAVCRCGWYDEGASELDVPACPNCGLAVGKGLRKRTYIVPEFGFVAEPSMPKKPTNRPRRVYTNSVYLVDSSVEGDHEVMATAGGGELRHRYAAHGRLVVVNEGENLQGYRICAWCGAGEPARPQQRRQSSHRRPTTGRDCSGPWEWVSLGHAFQTDILQLEFPDGAARATSDVWSGVLYAIVEAASDYLELARDDLDGTLHYSGGAPTIVLYDDVPAGAGHVHRVQEHLHEVLVAAYERVRHCECGEETSCYRCLRGYRNQRVHDRLRRGAVAQVLGALLGHSPEGDAVIYKSVESGDLRLFDGRRVQLRVDGLDRSGILWIEEASGEVTAATLETAGATYIDLVPADVVVTGVAEL